VYARGWPCGGGGGGIRRQSALHSSSVHCILGEKCAVAYLESVNSLKMKGTPERRRAEKRLTPLSTLVAVFYFFFTCGLLNDAEYRRRFNSEW
jgi:hypothetical protein